jgi:hypothetical protein
LLLDLLTKKRADIIKYGEQLGFQRIGIIIPSDPFLDPHEFIATYVNEEANYKKNTELFQKYIQEVCDDTGLCITTKEFLISFISTCPEGAELIKHLKTLLINSVPLDTLNPHIPFESYFLPDLQEQIIEGNVAQIQSLIEQGALIRTPLRISDFRLSLTSIYPEKADQFDEAVAQASFTLKHNTKVLGHQVFYWYRLSKYGELPIEVSELVAEYVGIYGQKFDTGEAAVLRALVERKETTGSTRVKLLKQSDSSDEGMAEEAAENVKAEDSGAPEGSEKAESPSDNTDANGNSYSGVKKENNNDILAQLQQQDDTPFEPKMPETEAEKMKKEAGEDALVERAQKEKEKIRQELEEQQEVKAPNILDKENTEEEEENTNKDPETSMPGISDKFLYPPIPEEGVVESPTPIISDPSFVGSGVVSFAITCGLLALHHGKHLHGDVPPDHPDLFA